MVYKPNFTDGWKASWKKNSNARGGSGTSSVSRVIRDVLIALALTIATAALYFYKALPAIALSNELCFYVILFTGIFAVLCFLRESMHLVKQGKTVLRIAVAIPILCVVAFIVCWLVSVPAFRTPKYVERVPMEDGVVETDIPTEKDITKISLMDTDSAQRLGNRVIGKLSDVVSQYDVSSDYTTICYKGQVYKIAPLEYNGFFKYVSNNKNGIPGYVLVNPLTGEAEYVKVDQHINYSPSAYFSNYVDRKLRFDHPNRLFNGYTFQVDETGRPFWVATVVENTTPLDCRRIIGAIVLDASTGESNYYSLQDIPVWVDYVFDGDYVAEAYDSYGMYQGGFFNSLFSQSGCTKATNDFGYVAKDDDVFIYTGVTSVAGDQSNIGFIMVNSRTGEFKYYSISGAEEYSAMSAAQGVTQNYGYTASFPSLVSVNNEATYVMVLKDKNSLVKKYAMVNYENYTIVAVQDTLEQTLADYKNRLGIQGGSANDPTDIGTDAGTTDLDAGNSTDSQLSDPGNISKTGELHKKQIRVQSVENIAVNGNTITYIKSYSGEIFKQIFTEQTLLLESGDYIVVSYYKGDTIHSIAEWKSVR